MDANPVFPVDCFSINVKLIIMLMERDEQENLRDILWQEII